MYELFGGLVDQTQGIVTFKLFIPDGQGAPYQYEGGGPPQIKSVSVIGSFQYPTLRQWDAEHPVPMVPGAFIDPAGGLYKGTVYAYTSPRLPPGFYEYCYLVEFKNGEKRYITDPCARYGGENKKNSGFVIGGNLETVRPLRDRLPYHQLVVYELMIDDFAFQLRQPKDAPLQTILKKLDYLAELGVNAIEFMPWFSWLYPDDPQRDFSWGYNPVQYFSVAHKYTNSPGNETDKLVYLKQLINACHERSIQVIMDGVFNHADATPPDLGFPYYWLYQDPADSPYVGNFAEAAYFRDLDYANQCTLEYIRDACIYWIEEFKIDGIRLDNTLGFYRPGDRGHGLPKLLSELRGYLANTNNQNFALILEHSWDYAAIDVANKAGATSCWFDKFRSLSMGYLGDRPQGVPQIEPSIMRMLDAGKDFDEKRGATIYVENHDHKRFMLKAGGREHWYLTQPYLLALFTCAGTPLIYNGQEFGMANDMPESGDQRVIPRPLDWSLRATAEGGKLWSLYRALIAVRKNYPALGASNFYPREWDERQTTFNEDGLGLDRERNLVVYHRWGLNRQGDLELFYVALNFAGEPRSLSFNVAQNGRWTNLLDRAQLDVDDHRIATVIDSNWGAIYYQRQ